MIKYIWATDPAQFEVNDDVLKTFKTFDSFDEAFQDAVDHFCQMDDYKITVYIAQVFYDDLTQQDYFNRILTDIEAVAFKDYYDYDLEIAPSKTLDDPKKDIAAKYNDELKKLINRYLTEIGKRDKVIYPYIIDIRFVDISCGKKDVRTNK